ncbi:MAG: hypothetical protein PHY02_10025 [Phycisphaerae bacterium]|nr:hypothetical protein [Phycisphaerae bacterium]
MNANLEKRHLLVLNIAGDDGAATIFIYNSLPEQIVDVKPLVSGGAEVTLTLPNRELLPFKVTQSEEEIRKTIALCKKLDNID